MSSLAVIAAGFYADTAAKSRPETRKWSPSKRIHRPQESRRCLAARGRRGAGLPPGVRPGGRLACRRIASCVPANTDRPVSKIWIRARANRCCALTQAERDTERGVGMSRFERPHYFAGKLLTADDLELEQRYHIEKRWLLNRTFHGEGVVHGLEVAPGKGTVSVSPGFALDEYGREIEVCERQQLPVPGTIETISI